jgi:hypothetical protein
VPVPVAEVAWIPPIYLPGILAQQARMQIPPGARVTSELKYEMLICLLFFNHKTIQLCQKIKKAEETRVATAEIAGAIPKEGLHQPIEKHAKEYHAKVVKLQKVVAVKVKADVEAIAIKVVNHFFN